MKGAAKILPEPNPLRHLPASKGPWRGPRWPCNAQPGQPVNGSKYREGREASGALPARATLGRYRPEAVTQEDPPHRGWRREERY